MRETAAFFHDQARTKIAAGHLSAAGPSLKCSLLVEPDDGRTQFNFGVLNTRTGQHRDAILFYRRSLLLKPGYVPATINLCDELLRAGEEKEADVSCQTALNFSPASARLYTSWALVKVRLNDRTAATGFFQRALALDPSHTSALSSLAVLWHDEAGNRAEKLYRYALACDPARNDIYGNLGALVQAQGRIEDAIAVYKTGLASAPDDLTLRANLSAALLDLGEIPAAMNEARHILREDPGHAEALWVETWVNLLNRDLERGWRNYDLPWSHPGAGAPQYAKTAPLWDGTPLSNGKLFLWCERGIGDEVLYAGMLNDALALGVPIVMACDSRLIPLFSRTWPEIAFISKDDDLPLGIAAQSSILRLPLLFRKAFTDFPNHSGYLKADPDKVAEYKACFDREPVGRKVGLAWKSGNPRTGFGKSTRLEEWKDLLEEPSNVYYSLQYNQGSENHSRLTKNPGPDIGQDLDALAAQISALDHIVSISGITAHLAGALGKPGHVLLPAAPVWFWFNSGRNCPWYPSLQLIRGNRTNAIHTITGALS